MKRRILTKIRWNLAEYGRKGLATSLPVKPQDTAGPLYLSAIEIISDIYHPLEGRMHFTFDRDYGVGNLSQEPTTVRLISLHGQWYRNGFVGSSAGVGNPYQTDIKPLEKDDSFCDTTVENLIHVLGDLGIKREQLPIPKVTQETYVDIPKKYGWRGDSAIMRWGWMPFGEWLAIRHGLSKKLWID